MTSVFQDGAQGRDCGAAAATEQGVAARLGRALEPSLIERLSNASRCARLAAISASQVSVAFSRDESVACEPVRPISSSAEILRWKQLLQKAGEGTRLGGR